MTVRLVNDEDVERVFNMFLNRAKADPRYPEIVVDLIDGVKTTVMEFINKFPEGSIDGIVNQPGFLERMLEHFVVVDGEIKLKINVPDETVQQD